MVWMDFPSHSTVIVLHERIGFPSISTVQEPQLAWSQPILVPVRPSVSRRVCDRVSDGPTPPCRFPTVNSCFAPFTVRVMNSLCAIVLLLLSLCPKIY